MEIHIMKSIRSKMSFVAKLIATYKRNINNTLNNGQNVRHLIYTKQHKVCVRLI